MMQITEMSQGELAAYIQTELRKQSIDLVLTGGSVVSLYSDGKYISMDLDFVEMSFSSSQKIGKAMLVLGFTQKGRHYVHPGTKYFVEFVAPPLSVGNEPVSRIDSLKLETGVLKVISPTDCVKDRLAGFYHWNDQQSLQQALLVATSQPVDLREIERWSAAEGMQTKYLEFSKQLR